MPSETSDVDATKLCPVITPCPVSRTTERGVCLTDIGWGACSTCVSPSSWLNPNSPILLPKS